MTTSVRAPLSELLTLATADDVDRSENTVLTATGCEQILIIQKNDGTPGTLGIDVVEVSVDGVQWVLATTAAMAGVGIFAHAGILLEDGSKAAAAGAALNAAGVEPATGASIFSINGTKGPLYVRVGSATLTSGTAADWATGAPGIYAICVGGKPSVA